MYQIHDKTQVLSVKQSAVPSHYPRDGGRAALFSCTNGTSVLFAFRTSALSNQDRGSACTEAVVSVLCSYREDSEGNQL